MIVTPGYTFDATETVDATKLNELGQPTVEVEASDITPFIPTGTEGNAAPNYLRNGNFSEPYWTRGASAITCPTENLTYRADWWFCFPHGGSGATAAAYERILIGSDGPDNRSLHGTKLTGHSSLTTVDFGQDIKEHLSTNLRAPLVASFWLYNGSGAAFTPSLRLDTADSSNNFSGVTNRYAAAASASVANANWKQFTFAVDATSFPNMTNGLRMIIRIPTGALNSDSKYVKIAQVKLERGTAATTFVIERDEVAEGGTATTTPVAPVLNFFDNPAFPDERFLAASLTINANVDGYTAEGWFARPGGANGLVAARDPSPPNGAGANCIKCTGATGVSTLDFGQNLDAQSTAVTTQNLAVSFWIYNGTGGAFSPLLRVDTCNTTNDFTTRTNRREQTLDECADGAWTRVSYTFDAAAVSAWDHGAQIYVRIPDGSLASGGAYVAFAEPKLELGVAATDFASTPQFAHSSAPVGHTRELLILGATTAATVTGKLAVLEDVAGRQITVRDFNCVISINASGVNGLDTGSKSAAHWYYVWLISDGVNTRGLLSLNYATDPVMPAGYRYRARIGAVYWVDPAMRESFQMQDLLAFTQVYLLNGTANGATNWTLPGDAALITAAIPLTAIEIGGSMGRTEATGTHDTHIALALDVNGAGAVSVNLAYASEAVLENIRAQAPFRLPVTAGSGPYYKTGSSGGDWKISVTQCRLQ